MSYVCEHIIRFVRCRAYLTLLCFDLHLHATSTAVTIPTISKTNICLLIRRCFKPSRVTDTHHSLQIAHKVYSCKVHGVFYDDERSISANFLLSPHASCRPLVMFVSSMLCIHLYIFCHVVVLVM